MHRPIAYVVALVFAGCAAPSASVQGAAVGPTDDPLADGRWHPPVAHQECVAIEPRVASVSELADSAAIVAALAGAGAGHALWTVAFTREGAPGAVRLLEWTIDDGVAGAIANVVHDALRPQAGETYVRLRADMDEGAPPRVRLGGVQYCRAALVNVESVRRAIAALGRHGVVELRLYVDAEGRVREREVVTSSGDAVTDRMVLGLVSGMRYSPARLDRMPVPALLSYRVSLD